MNMKYEKDSSRKFDEVVADVEKLTVQKNFRVLHIHDVQATVGAKGFQREPLKIIEICNARFAHEALQKNMDVSLFMPCKINVYAENGTTKIIAMRLAAIAQFLPDSDLHDLAESVDKVVTEIVDRAAAG